MISKIYIKKESGNKKIYNISDYPLLDTYTTKILNGEEAIEHQWSFGALLKIAFNGELAKENFLFVTKSIYQTARQFIISIRNRGKARCWRG